MPRSSQLVAKRDALLPVVTRTFAELGYRRTTTAELARRCGVQENILYRLWPDKKGMFIAAIGHVFDSSAEAWRKLLESSDGDGTVAERILSHEARHYGKAGYYRIVFAGLSETDDADIRAALADMYQRYHRFVQQQISAHRRKYPGKDVAPASLAAWAIVGLGTVASLSQELGLLGDAQRRKLIRTIGRTLLDNESG